MDSGRAHAMPVRELKRTQLRTLTVVAMIYILVSGGPFGIEDMISGSGPGLTLLLLLALPLFWSLPMALVTAELGSAIPGEGGFYVWTRRALGDFWGFQAAWWWSLSTLVDSAIYVVLAVGYLQNFLGFDQLWYYLACWTIIAVFTLMNIVGVRVVAVSSTIFSLLILAPFAVLIVVGLAQWRHDPFTPFAVPGAPLTGPDGVLALGLALGIWMYSGYEAIATLSGELRNPQRLIPRALLLVVPLIVLSYLLTAIASLAGHGDWERFAFEAGENTVSFIEIGRALGGPALGMALLGSALLGNLALYLDYLASGARPLFAIAADGLFPPGIARVSARFGTPVAAILLMAAVNALLVLGPFRDLVVIDVMLFASAYVLIYIAVVRLRIAEPALARPYRVPFGTAGMVALVIPPILLVIVLVYLNMIDRSTELFGVDGIELFGIGIGWYGIAGSLALLSGPPLYYRMRRRYGGPPTPSTAAGNEAIALARAEAFEDAAAARGSSAAGRPPE